MRKGLQKNRTALAEVHARAAVLDDLATDCPLATDEMPVFGAHPYNRSSELGRGLCNSHSAKRLVAVRVSRTALPCRRMVTPR